MRPENLFRLLSDRTRIGILIRLEKSPAGISVGEIARSMGAKTPAISQHLKILKHAGLIDSHKEGRSVVYRMGPAGRKMLAEAVGGLPGVKGRQSSRLSARNRLLGTVTAVERDQVASAVTLEVGGQRVQAVITTEALDELGLAVGDHAYAVVKATEVMLMR